MAEVELELSKDVAVVRINRPDKLNALNAATIARLGDRLDEIENNSDLRCVILTGAGERAFCAGADIKGFSEIFPQGAEATVRQFVRHGQSLTTRIEAFSKPVIAAVNGAAYGGGCELVEAAHIAIASDAATFAQPEINLGIIPGFGGTQRLARHVGRKRALELMLTGDRISALQALEIGLVNAVVRAEDLMIVSGTLATRIAGKPSLAVTACLDATRRGAEATIEDGLAIEASAFGRLVTTADAREGIDAFLTRRSPSFRGL